MRSRGLPDGAGLVLIGPSKKQIPHRVWSSKNRMFARLWDLFVRLQKSLLNDDYAGTGGRSAPSQRKLLWVVVKARSPHNSPEFGPP
ncbi:hypothetical protein EMIHUDRAFT_239280 [Emiliania huxleyi CCMP1516]|uniref:Uncharacterized protein n=2 Tax=Emiliania huxleyi TaxID=2903 RepID=A0A0D3JJL7_EMIH1|nr:hypothetical protein EMIHUDRAFT_239280 [Emiliania huxleyi CCMP1516]EOD23702.1 hypothetical protein EMIHUDRAFT_239280 [Emiliania huxleyi CCMP1516]|eukprot:XP_005776131.1 hypothetical protein EMIHUDRAFT_239280 [Emiliania huxleyi CCMP1516]